MRTSSQAATCGVRIGQDGQGYGYQGPFPGGVPAISADLMEEFSSTGKNYNYACVAGKQCNALGSYCLQNQNYVYHTNMYTSCFLAPCIQRTCCKRVEHVCCST